MAGNPTSRMQNAAFDALGLDWRYVDLRIEAAHLERALEAARILGFAGLNVTVPHKVAIVPFIDRLDASASLSGAVNTVVRLEDGTYVGYNTDGDGFMASLATREIQPAGATVTLLGAGGAARAVGVALARAGAAELIVINRDPARREALATIITRAGGLATPCAWVPDVAVPPCDIVINCTPVGMAGDERPAVRLHELPPHALVCDMNPERLVTPFLAAASADGFQTLNGMGMLARGGAANFTLWTGREAPLDVMERALASALG